MANRQIKIFLFSSLFRNFNSIRNTLKLHQMSDDDRTLIFTEVCQQALKDFGRKKNKI